MSVFAMLILFLAAWRVSCLSDVDLVTVARCRVRCTREFADDTEPDATCTDQDISADCFMCWEICERLVVMHAPWSQLCESTQTKACTDGCKAACRFIKKISPRYNAPDRHRWRFPDATEFNSISRTRLLITWKTPETRTNAPFVGIYLLFWRNAENVRWNHFRTVQTNWAIFDGQHNWRSKLEFQLLAVGVDGVIAIARLQSPLNPIKESTPVETTSDYFGNDDQYVDADYAAKPEVTLDPDLQVDVHVEHRVDGHLKTAVSWRSLASASVYTVQWCRTGCIVNECSVNGEIFASAVEDEAQKYQSLMLPQVTFSSVYWVRVTTTHTSGRRVAQQVYFVTPTCQTLEHVTTICVNQDASEGPATNSSYIQSYTEANVVQQTTEYTSSSPSVEVITLAASSAFVSVSGSVAVSVAVTVAVSVVIFVVVVVVVARKRRAGSHNVV
ncbi:hypothetical protein LSAT2_019839 [Lamellibrachia satsuma]|nr:hypothetical protein LSAT2_019839 [Lamellibrachia satsuma]